MYENVVSEIAPTGTLRAGINLANIFLVTNKTANGDPDGVSPNIAKAIADKLGVSVAYVPCDTPGQTADAIRDQICDIVLIADEAARAEFINFTDAYVEIEATYIVPVDSTFQTVKDVDQTGVSVAVSGTSAYDLYLTRTLKHADLHRAEGLPAAATLFANENLDALAGLRPALNENLRELPHCRILDGRYMTVQQAIGTKYGNLATIEFLQEFILDAKESGLILDLLNRHDVNGKIQVAR
jgi:polar amino acid transport system substrate-binding protein